MIFGGHVGGWTGTFANFIGELRGITGRHAAWTCFATTGVMHLHTLAQ